MSETNQSDTWCNSPGSTACAWEEEVAFLEVNPGCQRIPIKGGQIMSVCQSYKIFWRPAPVFGVHYTYRGHLSEHDMNLIRKISKLNHPGVLCGFEWPLDLYPFARFNLIYGRNGSGKTTISRVFRNLQFPERSSTGEATLCINGQDLDSSTTPRKQVPIRVFNRDFIRDSVFQVNNKEMPPIFVLGKESAEKQAKIEALKQKRSKNEQDLDREQRLMNARNRDLNKFCTREAKTIKDALSLPGRGEYNHFDKAKYRHLVRAMAGDRDTGTVQLDDSASRTLRRRYTSPVKPRVDEVAYQLPSLEDFLEQVAALRATTVMSSVLQTLKDDPPLGVWTHQGLQIHKDRNSQDCLFCEQAIPPSRLEALESHFSTEYDLLLQDIEQLREDLRAILQAATTVSLPDKARFYDDLTEGYDSISHTFELTRATICKFASTLIQSLDEKRTQPFRKLDLDTAAPEIDDVVSAFNEIIRKHNSACDDFVAQTRQIGESLANNMIAKSIDEFGRIENAATDAKNAFESTKAQIEQISEQIERLESEIRDHRRPANDLNADLHRYLGHSELQFEARDAGYTLMRGEAFANSLSEGETTAIALLYFLKSLTDERFDIQTGIVVLDDPVSSLDSNTLYLAFGYIKERTKEAAQLFVLTHNFTFFRQVRNWFRHIPGQKRKNIDQRPARFYMLERDVQAAPRRTAIRLLDPMLETYESEYHYLFAQVYRGAYEHEQGTIPLELAYSLSNTARRLLEMFLAFRHPNILPYLWKKVQATGFDETRKNRIIRFVNTYSHGDTIGESGHDLSILGEGSAILGDVMELIQQEDPKHYNAMVGMCAVQ